MNQLTLPTISFSQVYTPSLLETSERRRIPSSTFPPPVKDICAVCADSASGYHYGVLTCLGCKTFFRRTVANGQNFHCRFNNNCRINKDIRCACRACRFRKCLEVGMDASGVHRKEKAPVEPLPGTSSSDEASPLPKIPRTPTLIERLVEWERTQIDRRRTLYSTKSRESALPPHLEQNAEEDENMEDNRKTPSPTPDAPVQMRMAHTTDLNVVSQVDLLLMLEWAEFQEPFAQLSTSDKTALLKDFTMQCLILEHGYYTVTQGHRNIWVFPNDTYLPRRLADLPAEFFEKLSKKRRQFQDQCVRFSRTHQSEADQYSRMLKNRGAEIKNLMLNAFRINVLRFNVRFLISARGLNHTILSGLALVCPTVLLCLELDYGTLRVFRLFSPLFTRLIDEVAGPLHELRLSVTEWCALKALLFWNPGNVGLSPEAKPLVEKVKCDLLSALFIYYADNAIPNHAIRFGNVLLLAPAIASIGLQAAENFQLLRFFGIANFDRFLEEFLFK